MKLLKYILLALMLLVVLAALYLGSLDGKYDVTRSRIIEAPREVVFNEINDYKNWKEWGPWYEEDSTIAVTYGENTVGLGASYTWTGVEGDGQMQTLKVEEPSRIEQEIVFFMPFGEMRSDIHWTMEAVEQGTELTWSINGEMPFFMRFMAANMEEQMGPMEERGLELFAENLENKLNTYSIEPGGVVDRSSTFYLYLTASSRIDDMGRKFDELMKELDDYIKDSGLRPSGYPFAIYHEYDEENGTTMFSVAYPVPERISTEKGTNVLSGFLDRGSFFKTVLNGNYNYLDEAWQFALTEAGALKDYVPVDGGEPLEIYVEAPLSTPDPSKWITEIYIPVQRRPSDSLQVN